MGVSDEFDDYGFCGGLCVSPPCLLSLQYAGIRRTTLERGRNGVKGTRDQKLKVM